jgi:hypothetical protein
MVGSCVHRNASADFEQEAHGRQAEGHCPGIDEAAQYPPMVPHGVLHMSQPFAPCTQHISQLGSSEPRQPISALSPIGVQPDDMGVALQPLQAASPSTNAANPRALGTLAEYFACPRVRMVFAGPDNDTGFQRRASDRAKRGRLIVRCNTMLNQAACAAAKS